MDGRLDALRAAKQAGVGGLDQRPAVRFKTKRQLPTGATKMPAWRYTRAAAASSRALVRGSAIV